ncbi:MAG: DNA mismatch repair protein MutL, partial [Bacteroidetes bacterium]
VLQGQEPCAVPDGTSIAVRNLFYNVPARRNFLKSPATEFKHLVETFQFLALSNPSVGFTLIHDENEVYRLAPSERADPMEALEDRILSLFGNEYEGKLIPVEETTSYLSVYGFVGAPDLRRKSRGEQFLFVNGRYVRNRYLDHAVRTAYGDALPEGAHPFCCLFLQLDPRHVDVNVHPTKAEVKFDDERGVYGFLLAVVKKGLGSAELTPELDLASGTFIAAPTLTGSGAPPASVPSSRSASRPAAPVDASERRPVASPGLLTERLYRPAEEAVPVEHGIIASTATTRPADDDAPEREPLLWQLHDAYILTQIRSGLMIVDQNAAHERVLYEKALENLKGGFGLSQQLLFPHTLEFAPDDHELIKELLPDLRSLGFDIELFSGRSVVIRGVPAEIRAGDERTILLDILDQYKTFGDTGRDRRRDALAKSIARRSAIKAGTKLSVKEMRTLIDQLFLCEMPYACPQGRPTMIKITTEELQKRFAR